MTQINTATLRTISTVDFETFKDAWITGGTTGNDVASRYYRELKQQGTATGNQNIVNYAELARHVAGYSGVNGVIANEFSQVVAGKYGVDFSIGSDNWLRMQYTLMRNDLQERQERIANNGTGDLSFQNVLDVHQDAFDAIGLPPEAFSLYTPLSHVAQYDPAKAQLVFAHVVSGDGVPNILNDGLILGFVAGVSTQQDIGALLRDYGNQAVWMGTVFRTLENLVGDASYPGDASELTDLLDKYDGLSDIAGLSFFGLADWSDRLRDFAEEHNWIWHIPGAVWDAALPDWLPLTKGLADGSAGLRAGSPLVLDLDGDGVETSRLGWGAAGSRTYFDMDNDGFAERTAWATGGDGLLAFDRNGNGRIDGQSELFGNSAAHADGFAALRTLDSNADSAMTSADTQFANLRVWIDANSDGVTDAGELRTLGSLGITRINLNATELNGVFNNENPVSDRSTFTMNGSTRTVEDVWFRMDQTDTRWTGDVTLDVRTLFLPTLKGFGELKDLHVAMSQDPALLALVQTFATGWSSARFAEYDAVLGDVRAILYKWAGVESVPVVDPRFPAYLNLDGRDVAFLEKFLGQSVISLPGSDRISFAIEITVSKLAAALLLQSGEAEVFNGANYTTSRPGISHPPP